MQLLRAVVTSTVMVLCILSFPARAQSPAPKTIGFMGVLNSTNGQHQNGPVTLTLSLYTAPTGGTALWSENQTVTATNGLFSTSLGSVTPFPPTVDFSQPYFVGI